MPVSILLAGMSHSRALLWAVLPSLRPRPPQSSGQRRRGTKAQPSARPRQPHKLNDTSPKHSRPRRARFRSQSTAGQTRPGLQTPHHTVNEIRRQLATDREERSSRSRPRQTGQHTAGRLTVRPFQPTVQIRLVNRDGGHRGKGKQGSGGSWEGQASDHQRPSDSKRSSKTDAAVLPDRLWLAHHPTAPTTSVADISSVRRQ